MPQREDNIVASLERVFRQSPVLLGQGLERIAERRALGTAYYAIFIDWMMPGLDGWQTSARIRSLMAESCHAGNTSVIMMVVWAPLGWYLGHDAVLQWGAVEWGFVAASGLLHVAYFVILLRGYRVADLTVVYPLARGSGPLLSSLVAITLLGEQISALGALGIVGVVGGVFLIAGGPGLLRAAHDPAARARVHKGIAYGLLTGAFIASYTVVDGYAVKVLLMSPILVDYMGNFVRVALLAPSVLRDLPTARQLWHTQWRYALLVAVVSPVAYVLVLFAMQQAPLSHVAPAREVSMLFAALIGSPQVAGMAMVPGALMMAAMFFTSVFFYVPRQLCRQVRARGGMGCPFSPDNPRGRWQAASDRKRRPCSFPRGVPWRKSSRC